MIIVLLIGLVILLLITYSLNGRSMSSPAFVFCASFVFMVSYAAAYTSRWKMSLHGNTAGMVLVYVAEFILVCKLVHDITGLLRRSSITGMADTLEDANLGNFKKTLILVVALTSIYLYIKYICDKSGLPLIVTISRIYGKSIRIDIPIVYKVLSLFTKSLGFWFVYPIANSFVMRKKIDWISVAIMLASASSTMFGGTRGVAVCMFVSLLGALLLLSYRKNSGRKRIGFKYIVITIIVFVVIIRNFSAIGNALGRKTSINPMDYSAAYCGAQIYNLDTFINGREFANPDRYVWGRLTFHSIEQTLSKYGIIEDVRTRKSYSPFRKSNGIFMGNVYTFFYSTLYDFGYVGTALFVAAVAFVFQIVYERARSSNTRNRVPLSIVIYGYCFPLMFFAFFSNWVTEYIVCTGFVWNLLFWILLDVFFFRIRIISHLGDKSDLFCGIGNI